MRRSTLRLYAPFIALAMIQASFVVLSPSKGENPQTVFAGQGALGANGSNAPLPAEEGAPLASDLAPGGAGAVDASGAPVAGGTAGGATTSGGTARPTGRAGAAGAAGTGGTGGGTATPGAAPGAGSAGSTAAAGDTSHCKGSQQSDVIFNTPPCAPKFVGNNGGPTYPGVTDKEILIVNFSCQPNEQVNTILASQGLAATEEETAAMTAAAFKFMNSQYEFYGRKLVVKRVIGDCPGAPDDPAKTRAAAAEIVKMKPFIVYSGVPVSGHDVWSQNGIISVGAPYQSSELYAGRRPYRWDIFPTGQEGAESIAEYYCKKLTGKPATNAGTVIHPRIPGGRDAMRKLAIVTPDNGDGATLPAARLAQSVVKECTNGKESPPIFTYASDIGRAEEQTRVTVAGLIESGATTVVCMCDPIAPTFLTKGMTQNSYFPEHVMPAGGLLDYDILGRLYDNAQWTHAFGPSQLVNPVPFEQSDAARIWRAAGNSGVPCGACNLITGYLTFIGGGIQQAGPNLNPLTFERGYVGAKYTRGGWKQTGGDPGVYLIKFGPGDYNAISDFREVYWDAGARSEIDGKPGAYVPIDNGRRYAAGELDGSFKVAAKPS